MKRFTVVIPKDDGGVELYPMKEWLRQHPEYVPPSLDATAGTSHQLRNGLKKMGWTIEEYEIETRLIMPSNPVLREAAHVLLGNPDAASDEPEERLSDSSTNCGTSSRKTFQRSRSMGIGSSYMSIQLVVTVLSTRPLSARSIFSRQTRRESSSYSN